MFLLYTLDKTVSPMYNLGTIPLGGTGIWEKYSTFARLCQALIRQDLAGFTEIGSYAAMSPLWQETHKCVLYKTCQVTSHGELLRRDRRAEIENKTAHPNKQLLDRLKRIEGQIRGLQRMIEDERSCSDIITQVLAARSALEQVGTQLLDHQLLSCFPGDDPSLETLRHSLRLWVKFGAGS